MQECSGVITQSQLQAYRYMLYQEEKSIGTIEKYLHDIRSLITFSNGVPITQEMVVNWKEQLKKEGYAPSTINSMLAAVNSLFRFLGWNIKARFLRIQRKLFREQRKELTKAEYERLVAAARKEGKERLALLMEAICATGIRVSEVPSLTVEAARQGQAEIALKGKIRVILLPSKLCRRLLKYAKRQKITSGKIFLTRSGKALSRRQIWAEMKGICKSAGVEAEKVFPHNLRHLFARTFYQACKNIVHLADVLGHSSIETTRIYLVTTGAEQLRQLNHLGLVS